jgi:hypothetical protein
MQKDVVPVVVGGVAPCEHDQRALEQALVDCGGDGVDVGPAIGDEAPVSSAPSPGRHFGHGV